jgi:hypothetical protein
VLLAESFDPDKHSWTRFLMTGRCSIDPYEPPSAPYELRPLSDAAQPWLSGRPSATPAVYLTDARARALGATVEHQEDEATGFSSGPLGDPVLVRRLPEGDVYAANLGGRNGGVVLSQYEPAGDRHRVIAVTRGCLNATEVTWFASGHGLFVGYGRSQHPVYAELDGFLVLDLRSGRAYRLDVQPSLRKPLPPGVEPESATVEQVAGAGFRPDALELASRTITLAELRRALP